LDGLRKRYGENHSQVQALVERIAQLKNLAAQEDRRALTTMLAGAQGKYELASAREAQLKTAFDAQRQKTLDLNSKFADYALLDAQPKRTERPRASPDARLK